MPVNILLKVLEVQMKKVFRVKIIVDTISVSISADNLEDYSDVDDKYSFIKITSNLV